MQCKRCKDEIPKGEERELYGQILCEDCYMDLLSPLRACDPWTVHSAKAFSKGRSHGLELNPSQKRILDVLKEQGPVDARNLSEMFHIKETDLERHLAALRRIQAKEWKYDNVKG